VLSTIRNFLNAGTAAAARTPGHEHRHLHEAVAVLLHEATRVDLTQSEDEAMVARAALATLFGLPDAECEVLLREGRERAARLTCYFAQVSVIKRALSLEQRIELIEQLWHVAYADGRLDPYEDHFVRKIAHLLYVPNTQCMLARSRARTA